MLPIRTRPITDVKLALGRIVLDAVAGADR